MVKAPIMFALVKSAEQRQNNDWQELGVKIVREKNDSDRIIKGTRQFYKDYGTQLFDF